MAVKIRKKILDKELAYAKKPLTLTLPAHSYVGTYSHPLAGAINVTEKGGKLKLKWGNLETSSTGFSKPDSLRVHFRPTRAQVVQFETHKNAVIHLNHDGVLFSKESQAHSNAQQGD